MVYFVQGCLSKKIKIGRTNDECPCRYVKTHIQARSGEKVRLLGIMPNGFEKRIQHVFRASWSHGEWFKSTDDLMAYITENAQVHSCHKCPTTLVTTLKRDCILHARSIQYQGCENTLFRLRGSF